MKTFYTSGGIGDSFIFTCRLFKTSKEEPLNIKHFTVYKNWEGTIGELYYHLLPGYVKTEFLKERPDESLEEEARRLPLTPHPDFKLQSINHFKLPPEYIALQDLSGIRKNRRLPEDVIQRKISNSGFPCVLLGSYKSREIKNAIDLRGKTNISEVVAIIRKAEAFYGPQGFLSFIACSQRVPTSVYILSKEDSKAVKIRIEKFKEWKRHLIKGKLN